MADEISTTIDGVRYKALVTYGANAGGGGGGGGSVPTGSAGSPNAAVVTVQGITGGVAQPVTGDVASGTTDSGAPQKIGGLVNTGIPNVLTTGQRVDQWFSGYGAPVIAGLGAAGADAISNSSMVGLVQHNGAGRSALLVAGYVFNGTTHDRQRGDTNGTYMVSKGSGGLATAQAAVTTTASQIVAARAGRGSVKITNLGTTDIYLGATGVSTTTGDLLVGTKGASITIPTNAAIFAIGAAAGSVSILEVF